MGEDPEYQVATDSETSAQRDARIAEIEAQKEENEEWGPVEAIPNIMADDTLYEATQEREEDVEDGEHQAAQAADMILETEAVTESNIHAAEDRDTADLTSYEDAPAPSTHGSSGVAREPTTEEPELQVKAARPHNDETIHSGYESDASVDPVFAALDGALADPFGTIPQMQDIDPSTADFDTTFDTVFAQGGAQDPLAAQYAGNDSDDYDNGDIDDNAVEAPEATDSGSGSW